MPSAPIVRGGHYRRSGSQPSAIPLLIVSAVVLVGIGNSVGAVPLWLWILIGVAVTAVAGSAIYLLVKQMRREDLQLQADEEAAELQKEMDAQKLADLKTVTPLATLLELNQSQIDEYHRIATDQADRSFRSSQRAMALGLVVIVGCFAAGLYFGNGQTKVFVAAIAGVAAALSAFLNRT
ncbi:hypothetical protein [Streptomyces xinghaiensis]|uniref:hypothetical protein n=1 Tax=Streptomyces xinghaiensis TaxID=1038928 RepID=UPI0012FF724E|nr:hypothetical protein [Streptomyces xinghaiensis]